MEGGTVGGMNQGYGDRASHVMPMMYVPKQVSSLHCLRPMQDTSTGSVKSSTEGPRCGLLRGCKKKGETEVQGGEVPRPRTHGAKRRSQDLNPQSLGPSSSPSVMLQHQGQERAVGGVSLRRAAQHSVEASAAS